MDYKGYTLESTCSQDNIIDFEDHPDDFSGKS